MEDAKDELRRRWEGQDAAALAGMLDYAATDREPREFPEMPGYSRFVRVKVLEENEIVVRYTVRRFWGTDCLIIRVRGPQPSRVELKRRGGPCRE